DAGNTHERDELRRTLLPRAVERSDKLLHLTLAADERCARLGREIDAEASPRLHDLPHRRGLFLSLGIDGAVLAVLDRLRRGAVRRLADEDAVRRRGRLQSGTRVNDVARRHTLA